MITEKERDLLARVDVQIERFLTSLESQYGAGTGGGISYYDLNGLLSIRASLLGRPPEVVFKPPYPPTVVGMA